MSISKKISHRLSPSGGLVGAPSIAVLGAGSWGTALSLALARHQQNVVLWDVNSDLITSMQQSRQNTRYLPGIPLPSNITCCDSLTETLAQSHDVLIVVPSHAFRSVLQNIKHHLSPDARVISATKGLDAETGQPLSAVFREEMGDRPYAVLSGPSFAKEVAANMPTAVTIASEDADWLATVAARFHQQTFHVYTSQDVLGVSLGGAVKNVMAIAVGMADGLGFGTNTKTALITRGLAEMMRLGEALGAQRETFTGLSGVGDLVLTCSDNQSRNRRFGLAIGQGQAVQAAEEAIGQVVEGKRNAQEVVTLARQHDVNMPIAEQVFRVLYENAPIATAVNALLARDLQGE